ncbi:MAG: tetratricopeptide repeat protein [Caldilineaceae bacterium]
MSRLTGSSHYELAVNYNNLNRDTLCARMKRAEQLYQQALAIKELVLGPDHPKCSHDAEQPWRPLQKPTATTLPQNGSSSAVLPFLQGAWESTIPM